MRALSPVDLHAHIDTGIEAAELSALQAIVFAVTRSLDEAEQALKRSDGTTIWGVGCHPGLVGVQKAFNAERFQALVETTPYVGELVSCHKLNVGYRRSSLTRASFAVNCQLTVASN